MLFRLVTTQIYHDEQCKALTKDLELKALVQKFAAAEQPAKVREAVAALQSAL
jgi:hypothetical protein